MRFGIYLNLFYHPGEAGPEHPGRPALTDGLEQARLCEEAGFDWIVLGERHLHPTGYHELLTSMAWLAGQTRRIGLATSGIILPLYPPLFLAEGLAHVDVLSAGRLTAGFVLGYRQAEFAGFGVDPQERRGRFEEALALIKRLWRGERVSHHGRFYTLEDAFIAPRPVQRPRPRLWNGGRVAAALERTARDFDGWTTSFNEEPGELREKISLYRSLPTGPDALGKDVVVLREGFCAPTSQEARRRFEAPLLGLYGAYADWKRGSPDASRYRRLEWEALAPRMVVGSPQQCVDQIATYQAMGADAIVLRVQPPGLDQRHALQSIELLGREVLPHFRASAHPHE